MARRIQVTPSAPFNLLKYNHFSFFGRSHILCRFFAGLFNSPKIISLLVDLQFIPKLVLKVSFEGFIRSDSWEKGEKGDVGAESA